MNRNKYIVKPITLSTYTNKCLLTLPVSNASIISGLNTNLSSGFTNFMKGKTGIPTDCFLSAFCKKGTVAETAFDTLIRGLRAKWVFLSYNSESIVSKEKMIEIMSRYRAVSFIEREYKRFKSFEYNEDKSIQEYLFFLEKKSIFNNQLKYLISIYTYYAIGKWAE